MVAKIGDPVTWNIPTAVDNGVSVPSSSQPSLFAPGQFLPEGLYRDLFYTFDDAAGNRAVCEFIIFVTGTLFSNYSVKYNL